LVQQYILLLWSFFIALYSIKDTWILKDFIFWIFLSFSVIQLKLKKTFHEGYVEGKKVQPLRRGWPSV
jgi:hypothetical protein